MFTDTPRLNNPLFQKDAYNASLDRVEQLKAFARNKGVSPAQISLAWLLTRPAVDLIMPGATKPEQIESNLQALAVQLTAEELAHLDVIFDQDNS
ncbi:L-glyceraldehyde 3-phosphate reductase [compost metagenome]